MLFTNVITITVCVLRYRLRILKGKTKELIKQNIRKLCEWKAREVWDLNIQDNHILIVVFVPPKVSISKLKGV